MGPRYLEIVYQFIRQTGEVGALPEVGFDASRAAEAPFVGDRSFDEDVFFTFCARA
jgi:hypothetical protein